LNIGRGAGGGSKGQNIKGKEKAQRRPAARAENIC